jgi:ABC-type sugar transport system permease subunit
LKPENPSDAVKNRKRGSGFNVSFLEKYAKWTLVLPMTAYLAAFTLYPILSNLYQSVAKGTIVSFLSLPFMNQTLYNTAIFSIGTTALEFLLGLLLAILVDKVGRGERVFSSVITIPLLVSPIAVGMIWLLIFDPQFGPLNAFLALFGIKGPFWIAQPNTIMFSAIVASTWEETPLVFLIIYAGLKGIPRQVYEAASIDGLGGLSMLRRITLPMLKPTLAVAILMALMTSFRSFDLVYMFSINGPFFYVQTLPYLLYQVAFVSNFQSYGSALSVVIMVIALIPTFVLLRLMKVNERLGLQSSGGGGWRKLLGLPGTAARRALTRLPLIPAISSFMDRRRQASSERAGAKAEAPRPRVTKKVGMRRRRSWRWAAYAFLIIISGIVLFPVYWSFATSLKDFNELFPPGGGAIFLPLKIDLSGWVTAFQSLSGYLVTSIVVSAAVVILTILMAVPAAYSISRFKTGGTKLVSWNIVVNSMPSVVFVLPLFYYVQAAGFYDTWWALISTYLIFTVPFAVWLLIGYMEDIPKQIDEAAKMDGLGVYSIVRRMVFPLMKPALVSTVLLSLMLCWHEFVFTLILGLTEFSGHIPIGARGVTVYISSFLSVTNVSWAAFSAAAVIISLPLILLAILLQRYFVGGLTMGAAKG